MVMFSSPVLRLAKKAHEEFERKYTLSCYTLHFPMDEIVRA